MFQGEAESLTKSPGQILTVLQILSAAQSQDRCFMLLQATGLDPENFCYRKEGQFLPNHPLLKSCTLPRSLGEA